MPARLTTEEFIRRAQKAHGDRYDYVRTIYTTSFNKLIITCRVHGDFEQTSKNHLSGSGCKKCRSDKLSKDNRKTTEDFVSRSSIIHNFRYTYDKVSYETANKLVIITCPIHGDFKQKPMNHLRGKGCIQCKHLNWRVTGDEFVKRSQIIHSHEYSYDKVDYVDYLSKVIITCHRHGDFEQRPAHHLNGARCPSCSTSRISRQSTAWLQSLNIDSLIYEHRIYSNYHRRSFIVDGYDSKTNTIYLYHGDYWHGNPNKFNREVINEITKKTMGELYDDTVIYEQSLKDLGYDIVVMWESDWLTQSK